LKVSPHPQGINFYNMVLQVYVFHFTVNSGPREYELTTEAHTKLSVIETATDPLSVCAWGGGHSWRAGGGQQ
jgi:hypothetical protein